MVGAKSDWLAVAPVEQVHIQLDDLIKLTTGIFSGY
jgi:hypothetical protein